MSNEEKIGGYSPPYCGTMIQRIIQSRNTQTRSAWSWSFCGKGDSIEPLFEANIRGPVANLLNELERWQGQEEWNISQRCDPVGFPSSVSNLKMIR